MPGERGKKRGGKDKLRLPEGGQRDYQGGERTFCIYGEGKPGIRRIGNTKFTKSTCLRGERGEERGTFRGILIYRVGERITGGK